MRPSKVFVHEKVNFNVARLKKFGGNFEVAVDADLAIAYKKAGNKDFNALEELLRSEKIFFDVKKGELASEERVKEVFGTEDVIEVANDILMNGEIQLTSEYREKLRIAKKKKLIELIHRTFVEPKTKLPHPAVRIENALQETKFKINEMQSAEEQMADAVSAIRKVMPISTETRKFQVYVPSNIAAKIYGMLKAYGTPDKELWNNDGSLVITMTISANLQAELVDKLNSETRGSVDIKILD